MQSNISISNQLSLAPCKGCRSTCLAYVLCTCCGKCRNCGQAHGSNYQGLQQHPYWFHWTLGSTHIQAQQQALQQYTFT